MFLFGVDDDDDDDDNKNENENATSQRCAEEQVMGAAAETLVLKLPMERWRRASSLQASMNTARNCIARSSSGISNCVRGRGCAAIRNRDRFRLVNSRSVITAKGFWRLLAMT